jgi:hypothetical protein
MMLNPTHLNLVQLYLPPENNINKDFLKQVLDEEKDFLELSAVKFVQVPFYDELGVAKLFPMMHNNPRFMKYFQDRYSKGRLPDRAYFFNVLSTVEPDYTKELIKNANEMRNSSKNEDQAAVQITISDNWYEKLNAMPFISSKFVFQLNVDSREQRENAQSTEERLEACHHRQETPQDQHPGDTGGVPPRNAAAVAGAKGGRAYVDAAEPDALALPEDADAQREEETRVGVNVNSA